MGVGLLIMKFQGFDMIPQLVEESKIPKKKLLIAFISSMFLTFLIYGLAIIAVGGIVTDEWMQQTDIVDPRVADMLGMHWLGLVIVVMGIGTCIYNPVGILAQRLQNSLWRGEAGTVFKDLCFH